MSHLFSNFETFSPFEKKVISYNFTQPYSQKWPGKLTPPVRDKLKIIYIKNYFFYTIFVLKCSLDITNLK